MPPFEIEPHTKTDKSFIVRGPGDLLLEVDYDDVDHDEVDRNVEAMVNLLNSLDGHFS